MSMKLITTKGFEFYLISRPNTDVLLASIKHINKNIRKGKFKYLMRNECFSDDVVGVWHEEQLSGKTIRIVGVNKDNDVICTAYLYRWHGNAKHTAKLGVTVDPSYQNKGIASMICEKLFEMGKKKGITRVESHPVAQNTSAIKLLTSLGFVSEGVAVKKFKGSDSSYLDCVYMAKAL